MRTASGRYRRPSSDGYWTTSRSTATDWPWCSCSPGACTRWNPARPHRRPVIHKLSSRSTPRRRRAPQWATRRRRRRTISRCATGWQHRPRTGIFARGNARTHYDQYELSSGRANVRHHGNLPPYAPAAHLRVGTRRCALYRWALRRGCAAALAAVLSGTATVGNKPTQDRDRGSRRQLHIGYRVTIGTCRQSTAGTANVPGSPINTASARSQVFPAAQLAQPALPQLEHGAQARRPGWASASSIEHPPARSKS